MLLRICLFHLLFAVIWAASIPSSVDNVEEKTIPSYVKLSKKLCSEPPTLNITEVCSTTKGQSVDTSNSTLKIDLSNRCDHAAYLVQHFCTLSQSNKNVYKTIIGLASSLNYNQTQNPGSFCNSMMVERKQLGQSKLEDLGLLSSCTKVCLKPESNDSNSDIFVIQPICNFILQSWNFLLSYNKSNPVASTYTSPPAKELKSESKSESKPPIVKPNTSTSQLPSEQPVQAQPDVQNAEVQKDIITSPVENLEPDVKEDIPAVELENDNDRDTALQNKNSIAEVTVKTVNAPSIQMNSPSVPTGQDNLANPSLQVKTPESLDKSQAPVKPEEENTGERNEDDIHYQDIDKGQPSEKSLNNPKSDDIDDNEEDDVVRNDSQFKENIEHYARANPVPDEDSETEDSHFFVFFFVATFVCIVFYLIYQNKRKIIAMALEGKKGRHTGRRRPTSANYQKLDNKLDEVMAAGPPPSKTHVIY